MNIDDTKKYTRDEIINLTLDKNSDFYNLEIEEGIDNGKKCIWLTYIEEVFFFRQLNDNIDLYYYDGCSLDFMVDNLFIDKNKFPEYKYNVVIKRSFKDIIYFIDEIKVECPLFIDFGYILDNSGVDIPKTGLDVIEWIIEKDKSIEFNGKFIPKNFKYKVHGINSDIMKTKLDTYLNNK